MTNNQELKPCPFCGGKAVFTTKANYSGHHRVGFTFIVGCESCDVKLPEMYDIDFYLTGNGEIEVLTDERKEAIEVWNRRADK